MSKLKHATYWPYIICSYVALLAFGFLDNIRGPLYPDIIDGLSLSATQGALFFSLTSFMGFLLAQVTPWLLRKMSLLWNIRISLLFMTAGFIVFGFSNSLSQLLIGSFLFGVGFGIASVVFNYAIQVGAEEKSRQRLFSGLHANFALSSIIAPLIANIFIDTSWNLILLWFAAIPFCAFVVTLFFKDTELIQPKQTKDGSNKKLLIHSFILAFFFSFYLWGELSVATRFVYYLREGIGFKAAAANNYLVFFYVGLFLGRIITTKYQPPLKTITFLVLCSLLSGLSYFIGLLYIPEFIVFSGFLMAPCFPVYMEYLSQLFGSYTDRALALSMGISSLGVVLMHLVVGVMTDEYGIQQALLIGPLSFFILAAGLGLHNKYFAKELLARKK